MSGHKTVLPALVFLILSVPLHAEKIETSAAELANQVRVASGLTVRFDEPYPVAIKGKSLKPRERYDALRAVEAWVRAYPSGFLRRFADEVVIVRDLDATALGPDGHPADRVILLEYRSRGQRPFVREAFDHEVMHAVDGGLGNARLEPRWDGPRRHALELRAGWDDYTITPSHRYSFKENGGRKAPWYAYVPVAGLFWMFGTDVEANPPAGFASPRGLQSPAEDRATVAERLMNGSDPFLRRAAGDRELREKVEIVRSMYEVASLGAMSERFWADLARGAPSVPSVAGLDGATPGAEADTPIRARARGGEPDLTEAGRADSEIYSPVLAGPPVVAVLGEPERASDDRVDAFRRAPAARVTPSLGREEVAAPPAQPSPVRAASPTPAPRPVVTPPPAPATPVQRATPTPAPASAPPAKRPTAELYSDGARLFGDGADERAVAVWREMLDGMNGDYATIRVAINCSFDNVRKNQGELVASTSFYAVPYRHNGKPCYLSMTGLYRTVDEAQLAVDGLPPAIRAQSPRVMTIGAVQAAVAGR